MTGDLTIVDAVIFDGIDVIDASTIRMVDGVIVELGSAPPSDTGSRVISARGNTVVPGLIDAHFHAYAVSLDSGLIESLPMSYVALAAARRLSAALGRGFTTVRDVAGGDAGLAKAIDTGLIPSPRYLFTGAAFSQTGGHGDPRSPDTDTRFHGGRMCELVDGVDELRRAVRERFRQGAHAIKLLTSGGVISPSDPIRVPQYSLEEIRAVAEEAARRGSYVAAHAYSPEAIIHSVSGGVRSIEHGNLLDADAAAVMAASDAFLVPTLAAYAAMDRRGDQLGLARVSQEKNREVLDAGRRALEIAREAGVSIGFGSDLMGDLEDEQLNGLRLQAEVSGVLDALRSATSVNAELLRRGDLGRIGPGAAGDLVLLDGDPFDDPATLWDPARPRRIVQAGAFV